MIRRIVMRGLVGGVFVVFVMTRRQRRQRVGQVVLIPLRHQNLT